MFHNTDILRKQIPYDCEVHPMNSPHCTTETHDYFYW